MGDGSPDQLDLVCPSCGTEFRRIVATNRADAFDCPSCGEPVPVDEGGSGSDRGGANEFEDAEESTDHVPVPEDEDSDGGDVAAPEDGGGAGTSSDEDDGSSVGDELGSSRGAGADVGAHLDPAPAAGEETGFGNDDVHAQKTTVGERPRDGGEPDGDSGQETEQLDEMDPEVQKTPAVGMDKIAERMAGGEVSSEDGGAGGQPGKTPKAVDAAPEGVGEESTDTVSGGDGEDSSFPPGGSIGADSTEAVAASEQVEIEADGPPTAPQDPPGNEQSGAANERSSEADDLVPESRAGSRPSSEGEDSNQDGSARTPSAGLDKAFDDTVPPEIEEETEEAVDEALDRELAEESDDEATEALQEPPDDETPGLPGPSSAEELVSSLRGGTEDDETEAEEPPESEGGIPSPAESGGVPAVDDESEGPPVRTPGEDADEGSASSGDRSPVPELDEDDAEAPSPPSEPPSVEAEDVPPSDIEGRKGGGGERAAGAGEPEDVSSSDGAARPGGSAGDLPPEATGTAITPEAEESTELTREAAEPEAGAPESGAPGVVGADDAPRGTPEDDISAEPDADPAVQTPASPEGNDGGGTGILWVAAAGLGAVAVALGAAVLLYVGDGSSGGDGPAESGESSTGSAGSAESDWRAAVEQAKTEVRDSREAADDATTSSERRRSVADRLFDEGEHGDAAEIYSAIWSDDRSNTSLAERYLSALQKAGEFREARRVATEAVQTTDDRETFAEYYYGAVEGDERLGAYDWVAVADLEGVSSLEVAKQEEDRVRLTLVGSDGEALYLFWPAVSSPARWRDDVAAWRLCELLVCSFEIPRTRAARLSRETLRELSGGDSAGDGFEWSERSGETVVAGSLRRARPDAVRWPIEVLEVWRLLLSASNDPSMLEAPLEETLSPLASGETAEMRERILAQSGGAGTREIARQLSDIVLFDFLVNNWGRFADDESRYGVRNHFANGRFVTLRTDTVFQRRSSRRVKGRFGWVSRFGRDRVTALRLLEPKRVDSRLYPDATPFDEAKLGVFWEQRDAALDRIDELVRKYGSAKALTFE